MAPDLESASHAIRSAEGYSYNSESRDLFSSKQNVSIRAADQYAELRAAPVTNR